jgi:aminoglycoside phosphotransferase family enzyme/predicted kinase
MHAEMRAMLPLVRVRQTERYRGALNGSTYEAGTMGTIKEDLSEPGLELVETHISWVFLGDWDVWKVKKPVSLGFLNFSTVEQRRAACDAEVRLNRRLAPGVYRGIVPVTVDSRGRHRIGGDGEPVDWAVHMVRLPDADRADIRLREGRLSAALVEAIASRLAKFHVDARCDAETSQFGTIDAIGVNVRENFQQTRKAIHAHLSPEQAEEIERWQYGFLEEYADLFGARIAGGRVRDGHGDLRLQQVYCRDDGEITIIDCIEFNERFRYADVCADVAFFSMDLAWHERVDLAEYFLACYAREASDYDLYPLVDFYESYRAYVRGKVATILLAEPGVAHATRERAAHEARRYFVLALASERRSVLPPLVVAVGGVLAAGKSTVATQIGQVMAAPVVDTDRTRKVLLGVDPTKPLPDAPWVYNEVFRRADAVLGSGRPVVLDASFRSAAARQRARALAENRGIPFYFVECRAPADVCRDRLQHRAEEGGVSDGRLEIFDDFLERWEAVNELPRSEHLVVDTTRPLEQNLTVLRGIIPMWPEQLTV